MKKRALVVTQDAATESAVVRALTAAGLAHQHVDSVGQAAAALAGDQPFSLIVVEGVLPDGTVLGVMSARGGPSALTPVVVVSAPQTAEVAVEAMARGAEAFLTAPVPPQLLAETIRRALGRRPPAGATAGPETSPFLGTSATIRALSEEAERLLDTEAPLLIQGETGTGKGVLARWIHARSPRAAGPFVDLNCASLSKDLFESELLGHDKGAFTGASTGKAGLIATADGGTMFLDEIGDLDLGVQPRLLKVIEEKRFRRLGSVREQRANVRFVAASNQDLARLTSEQRFRQDLLFRINTLTLVCPPLRERAEDIPVIARHLVESTSRELGRPPVTVADGALTALSRHPWTGNIRELRNVLERAVLLCANGSIAPADLRLSAATSDTSPNTAKESLTLEALQLRHIQFVLDAEAWNVERASQRLGVPRSTLYQKIKNHQLGATRSR